MRRVLGTGSTGQFYDAVDAHGHRFAIKVSHSHRRECLRYESEMYRALAPLMADLTIVPQYFGCFSQENFDALVMEHTSDTIQDLSDLDFSER